MGLAYHDKMDHIVSKIKNPELFFKDHQPQEFEQEFITDWVI